MSKRLIVVNSTVFTYNFIRMSKRLIVVNSTVFTYNFILLGNIYKQKG